MEVEFLDKFNKDLDKISLKSVKNNLAKLIVSVVKKTLQFNPVRRFNSSPLRRSNLTPSKHSIWSMFNSEFYTFNYRINRGSILVRRTGINLSDYSAI